MGKPLVLALEDITKTYGRGAAAVQALRGVSLAIHAGDFVAIRGASGSGKSTLMNILGCLDRPTTGTYCLDGVNVGSLGKTALAALRNLKLGFIFQGFNLLKRHTALENVALPLIYRGLSAFERTRRAMEMLDLVGLTSRAHHLPNQMSGGQQQRVAIARAFGGGPSVVVCDEPTSALDVSVQGAILNLLADLQRRERVTYLFISHDLGVVRYLSDRIVVLYLGQVMQAGPAESVFDGPHHPYTEALLSAVPQLDGVVADRIRLEGEIPSAAAPPDGCVFHTRCPRRLASGVCETTAPPVLVADDGHTIRCHIPPDELRRLQGGTL